MNMRHYPNTQVKGDHAELAIAAKLKALGWSVLIPFSEGLKYDLVAEKSDVFVRIQVKSSRYDGTSVSFNCYNSNSSPFGSNRVEYDGTDIDGFAVYNMPLDRCFWVPIEEANDTKMSINVVDDACDAVNPATEYDFDYYFDRP